MLPVLACIRNPLDRYVSQYEFGWWRTHPEDFPGIQELERFPDLSFEDFVYFTNEQLLQKSKLVTSNNSRVGWHTTQFVNWYSKNPEKAMRKLDRLAIADFEPITLLRTHRLNRDLFDFLSYQGLPAANVDFVQSAPKILPDGNRYQKRPSYKRYYTGSLKRFILQREYWLFDLIPELES